MIRGETPQMKLTMLGEIPRMELQMSLIYSEVHYQTTHRPQLQFNHKSKQLSNLQICCRVSKLQLSNLQICCPVSRLQLSSLPVYCPVTHGHRAQAHNQLLLLSLSKKNCSIRS